MTVRDALLGLWIVGAFAWVAVRVWRGNFSCFFGDYPWCEYWIVSPWWNSTYFAILVDAFTVPLLGLAVTLAAIWLRGGFREPPPRA